MRYNKGTEFSTIFYPMLTITLQDIKSRGSQAISGDRAMYLIVNSKPKAVLLPPKEYEMLIDAMEELEDLKIIEARKMEKTLGWDEVFPKRKKK